MFKRRKSLDELLELKRQVDAELSERSEAELEGLKQKLELLAQATGQTVPDLFGFEGATPKKPLRRKRDFKAKYRDPETGETWSGMGKPKKWLAEKEAAGQSREEFAIA